ncbi:SDR family oxidoreductase [Streptomyces sp. NPDC002125]
MRVAVAGGTGVVGRLVVGELTAAGQKPVVLARSHGVDLVSGTGLDAALEGVVAVIDVSNMMTLGRAKAVAFFGTAGRNLLDAGARAGVGHHLALSVVGVDRVRHGYYQGKLAQEETVRGGRVPWTVLRATQFHEFVLQTLDRSPKPLAVVPRMRIRPVAAQEVARHLVELVLTPPRGMAPEFAGPREEQLVDLVRKVLRARGERRLVLPVRVPGAAGAAMAGGGQLPAGPGPRGVRTFDEWLTTAVTRDG